MNMYCRKLAGIILNLWLTFSEPVITANVFVISWITIFPNSHSPAAAFSKLKDAITFPTGTESGTHEDPNKFLRILPSISIRIVGPTRLKLNVASKSNRERQTPVLWGFCTSPDHFISSWLQLVLLSLTYLKILSHVTAITHKWSLATLPTPPLYFS